MTRKRSPSTRRRGRRVLRGFLLLCLVAGGFAFATLWRERSRATRVAALREARDELRGRLAALRGHDPALAGAPQADVLIGVPEAVGARLLSSVATGYLGRTALALRDLRVRRSGRVRASTLFGQVNPGRYHVDVRILEVRGLLSPRPPAIRFDGHRVGVALPVRVTRGTGRATLFFRWDSRGLAGAVCGDFRARVPVSGTVASRTYTAKGAVDVVLEGESVVATPAFPDLAVNLRIEPSPDTWAAVERVLSERGAGCRAALNLVDVPRLLRGVLDQGFTVKVPGDVLKPLRLPVALRSTATIRGRDYVVEVTPRALTAPEGFFWYGANVALGPVGPDSDR